MHVSLSRARKHHRGRLLTGAALTLAGTMLATGFLTASSIAAQRTDADATITGSLPAAATDAPFEVRIEVTRPGNEGIELSARLSEEGGLITRPVQWKVRRALKDGGISAAGTNELFEAEEPIGTVFVEPGTYTVEATYGSVSIIRDVEVPKGHFIGATFVLNVGGLRTLSTLASEPLPAPFRAVHKVYAVGGKASGQLVATSDVPGGLMRLGAGTYRLESEIEPGNTVTRTDVSIKPGIMTTLQLDHQAGIASVNTDAAQAWTIADRDSKWTAAGTGPQLLTLAPGTYSWTAGNRQRTVIIEAGKRTEVWGAD
ncbi:MAG: hypothetical protein V2I51_00855 [Anderseniella sp.]|nr:hypothetical protein [Anderseniella sp.]